MRELATRTDKSRKQQLKHHRRKSVATKQRSFKNVLSRVTRSTSDPSVFPNPSAPKPIILIVTRPKYIPNAKAPPRIQENINDVDPTFTKQHTIIIHRHDLEAGDVRFELAEEIDGVRLAYDEKVDFYHILDFVTAQELQRYEDWRFRTEFVSESVRSGQQQISDAFKKPPGRPKKVVQLETSSDSDDSSDTEDDSDTDELADTIVVQGNTCMPKPLHPIHVPAQTTRQVTTFPSFAVQIPLRNPRPHPSGVPIKTSQASSSISSNCLQPLPLRKASMKSRPAASIAQSHASLSTDNAALFRIDEETSDSDTENGEALLQYFESEDSEFEAANSEDADALIQQFKSGNTGSALTAHNGEALFQPFESEDSDFEAVNSKDADALLQQFKSGNTGSALTASLTKRPSPGLKLKTSTTTWPRSQDPMQAYDTTPSPSDAVSLLAQFQVTPKRQPPPFSQVSSSKSPTNTMKTSMTPYYPSSNEDPASMFDVDVEEILGKMGRKRKRLVSRGEVDMMTGEGRKKLRGE